MLLVLAACAHAAPAALAPGDHAMPAGAYHVLGHGPTCVVIPGGPGLEWKYLRMEALEQQLTLVYLEPLGTGGSPRLAPGVVYTFERYAQQLEALRVALGEDRLCLIGHSYGGEIALRYAIDHPDRVSALVLYSAPSRGGKEFGDAVVAAVEAWKGRAWFAVAKQAMLADDPKTDDEGTLQWKQAVPLLFADWDAHAADYARAVDVTAYAACYQVVVPPTDFRPELAKITAPTLVLVGAHDFCCGERWGGELVAGIRGAKLARFEHSGHMAHLEETQRFVEVVSQFVRDLR